MKVLIFLLLESVSRIMTCSPLKIESNRVLGLRGKDWRTKLLMSLSLHKTRVCWLLENCLQSFSILSTLLHFYRIQWNYRKLLNLIRSRKHFYLSKDQVY